MQSKEEELYELVNDLEIGMVDFIDRLSYKEVDRLIKELSEDLINSKSGRTP